MLGYIKASPAKLDADSFSQYQGIYCSLCKQLGRRYGFLARMTLSYDFTFLATLRMALWQKDCSFSPCHCSFSPFCKRLACSDTETLANTADTAVLLTYYKLKDNIADSHGIKQIAYRFLLIFARRWQRKAATHLPKTDAHIALYMQKQAELEANATASVDAAADPFACFLAALISPIRSMDDPLYRFGYCLGRWIYLTDAIDDLPQDLKKGNYNPYVLSRGLTADTPPQTVRGTKQQAIFALNACLAECKAAYDTLTVYRFDPLLRNILYDGMPSVQQDLPLTKKERRYAAKQLRKAFRNKKKEA